MKLRAEEYSKLYGLIGRCLLVEIDAGFVEVLGSPSVISVLTKLDPRIESYLNRNWNNIDFDEAAADYCALFVLPKGVTQTASYWIAGMTEDIGHKLVAGVIQVLENFELCVEEMAMGNVPKDNIGLLLLLAAHLYELDEKESTQHGDDFVANFVLPWGKFFATALKSKSDNPVYCATAELLLELLPPV